MTLKVKDRMLWNEFGKENGEIFFSSFIVKLVIMYARMPYNVCKNQVINVLVMCFSVYLFVKILLGKIPCEFLCNDKFPNKLFLNSCIKDNFVETSLVYPGL